MPRFASVPPADKLAPSAANVAKNRRLGAVMNALAAGLLANWAPWEAFFLQSGSFPAGSIIELVIVLGFAIAICASLLSYRTDYLVFQIEEMLVEDFRLFAAEPLPDPKDPRLKKWQVRERLYHHRRQMLDPSAISSTQHNRISAVTKKKAVTREFPALRL